MSNESLRESVNRANPNSTADVFRALKLGDMLTRTMRRALRDQVPVASAETLGGLVYDRISLPDNAKASRVIRAWAKTRSGGAAALGALGVHAWGAVPTTTQVGIDGRGDLIFLHADLYTLVDVEYEPIIGDVVTLTDLPVVAATGLCTLPVTKVPGAFHLIKATSTAGTLIADMIVDYPASSAPATTLARIGLPGTIVYFAAADLVSKCDLTLVVPSAVEPGALLTADSLMI